MTYPGTGTYPGPGPDETGPSTPLETLTLDSEGVSPLTLQSGGFLSLDAFDPGVAQRRPNWAGGPESDGGLLVTDPPYDDAQGSFRVRFFPIANRDMPAALTMLGTLIGKLQECSASGPGGLACSWTPANHTRTYTLYLKLAEIDGLPIEMRGDLAGWLVGFPIVTVKFVRDPFLYGPEIGSVTDDFSADTLANYTADAGAAGNVSITGGVLDAVANLSTLNALVRTAGVSYPDLYDVQATVKATLGTTLSGFAAGVVLKRVASDTRLEVYVFDNGTSSFLAIDKVVAGVRTRLDTATLAARMTTSSNHWVRGRIEGSTVYAEHWTAAPTATGTPADTKSVALTAGAEVSTFGQGVAGKVGVVFTPMQSAASLDDFVVEPNVWVN